MRITHIIIGVIVCVSQQVSSMSPCHYKLASNPPNDCQLSFEFIGVKTSSGSKRKINMKMVKASDLLKLILMIQLVEFCCAVPLSEEGNYESAVSAQSCQCRLD